MKPSSNREGEKKIVKGLSITFYRLCVSMTIAITYLSIAGDVFYATGLIYSPFLAFLSSLVFWCAFCVVISCMVFIIGLLFINWTQLRWRLRVVKLVICICGLLIIPTAFYRVGPKFNTYLRGFGARIKNKADFADIRSWMMEVDLPTDRLWYVVLTTEETITNDNLVFATAALGYDLSSVEESEIPQQFELSISPNPCNSACRITTSPRCRIAIFDINGRVIHSFDEKYGYQENDHAQLQNDAVTRLWQPEHSTPSGIYLIRVTSENQTATRRMVFLK